MDANRMMRKRGTPASNGIGIGRAYLVDRQRLKVPRRNITEEQVEDEVVRLHAALEASDRQLERIKQKLQKRTDGDHHSIITAYQLILHDAHLVDETIRFIREKQVNADWAVEKAVEKIQSVFDTIDDDYFRERRSDVGFVGERVLRNLLGREMGPVKPPPDAIVVAHDLSPADAAQLHRAAVAGLVTDVGGKTSHTAIIARAHEIPAVIGLDDITTTVETGDLLIVDGSLGEVFINPEPSTVAEYRELAHKEAAFATALLGNRDLPADTADGIPIELLANIDHADEIQGAINHGAMGVGLFRTEFLFMSEQEELPSEEMQYDVLRSVISVLGGRKATIRTFDLGADKVAKLFSKHYQEVNPALGLRSIRLCLTEEVRGVFKTQLRALLRASVHGPMRIMFPMISGVDELRMARAVLDEAAEELRAEGTAYDPNVQVGVMIEVPSAAMVADLLAQEVDFFSIGTNDLIQYTLAVDRVNEHVSYLYQALHPSILRLMRSIIEVAERYQVPVSICGEMAGDPVVAPVLLGLGLRELSMNSVSIPEVKNIIRSCRQGDLATLLESVMSLSNVSEVRAAVRDYFLSANIDAKSSNI